MPPAGVTYQLCCDRLPPRLPLSLTCPLSPPPIETSSRQEFEEKLAKGNAMGPGQEKHADFWERIESAATERCSYAAPLGAAAQARLAQAATTGPGGGGATARRLRGQ